VNRVIGLCVTYSSYLLDLDQDADVDFGYIRLGNWHEQDLVDEALTAFSDKRYLYHHNGNVPHDEVDRQAFIRSLNDWQRRTDCPWLSFHLDYHKGDEIRRILRGELVPPLYGAEEAFEVLCEGVRQVQAQVGVPLILENMPSWPVPYSCLEVSPDFVGRVLEATGCGFLFDTAHARMTAGTLELDLYDYCAALPLDRVVEMHVSSPRYLGEKWYSSHEVLEEQDYAIVAWLLERTTPQAITLEYWRDRDQIRDQLVRLRELIAW
jgi:uncharacterized protein (UPF0276 family)